MRKLLLLAAGVAGYVLGARAGRERYEQIKQQTQKVWNSPTVQQGVDEAATQTKHAASAAGSKVAEAASAAGAKVADTVRSNDADGPADPSVGGPVRDPR